MNDRKTRKEWNKWNKLLVSVAIDLVGLSDFIFPGAAQIADIGWAPLSALIVQHLYHNKYLTTLNFIEEALPFTDIIPTATIGWFMEYTRGGKKVRKEGVTASGKLSFRHAVEERTKALPAQRWVARSPTVNVIARDALEADGQIKT